ncbi:MAG: hypothetical protein EXS17_04715 [Phycisphaerales bacterium]|nr:hypothetical protein [Phycisphaerales bacterium]
MNHARSITLAVAAITGITGCNILLPASYILQGGPKAPAAYELPAKRTAMLVDDRSNRMSRVALRIEIGETVATELLENDVIPEAISTRDSVAYARRSDSAKQPISIQRIGEALGAEQLIFIEVDQFVLSGGSEQGGPEAIALIKVFDITSGARLWPNAGSEAVQSFIRDIDPSLLQTSAGRREIEDKLAQQLGSDIAKIFYEHERRELGGRLGVKK